MEVLIHITHFIDNSCFSFHEFSLLTPDISLTCALSLAALLGHLNATQIRYLKYLDYLKCF